MIELNKDNFKKEISGLILVFFWSPTCGACNSCFPLTKELSKQGINVGMVNIFENYKIAKEYKIPATPTIIIFKNGIAVERAVGLRSKEVLIQKMNSCME
ncbi:MAG: thioredoxin family protein [Candidatus Pacebacteria bacterium]|nr:thioredoxin family protein [Candidatus Paceibacterota bacterium]